MVKPRRKSRLGPALFGLALVALTALSVHWVVLIYRNEQAMVTEHQRALTEAARRQDRRPSAQALERLREQRRRRMVMIIGEGSLALLLLGILCVMLLRVWRLERQRRREIEAFISTVSHELKTPLAGIKALLGTLQMGYVPADRLAEFVEMGLREADRLEHLVENLLIANRIRRSALEVRLEPVSLEAFLTSYRRHREALLPEGHEGLVVEAEGAAGLWVRADEDKLRVILENLTDNAIKYGGGAEVRVSVRAEPERVAVDVVDHGVGFDPADAASLFEGVRQNTGSGGALVHGSGLGLGIARDLARAMEGDLVAHSDGRDQGSRFSVELPRSAEPAAEPADATQEAQP